MKTVRGQLMEHPSTVFEIKTPDGDIRLSPNDIKMLLSGEMNTVVIEDCHYAALCVSAVTSSSLPSVALARPMSAPVSLS